MAEKKAPQAKTPSEEKPVEEKKPAEDKPLSKTAVYKALAERTGLEPKQVAEVFAQLEDLAKGQLASGGPGVFVIPGLVKLKRVDTPARPAEMRKNPFKPGEMMEVKAKEASSKVKPVILKGLKDLKAAQEKAPAPAPAPAAAAAAAGTAKKGTRKASK
jgi:hypothetical protein